MARYGYFWGCYIQGRLPHIEQSTRAVMQCLGLDCADLTGLTCCPEKTMIANMSHDTWLLTAARNLAVAEEAGVDFITPCPGCFGTLKGAAAEIESSAHLHSEVNRELRRVGRSYRGAASTSHILEILHRDVGLAAIRDRMVHLLTGMRIAVHYGCHLLRPSADLAFDDPAAPTKFDELVRALGATSISYEDKLSCCGGLLSRVEDEDTAHAMARRKLRNATDARADGICVACPSCFMQYDTTQLLLQRKGEELHIPVFYYTELLGLALGLQPEEVGLPSHRIDVGPFLQKWQARRAAIERASQAWDYDLLRHCAECGACAFDCPVARADLSFDPNLIIRRLAQGEVAQVLREGEFWRCVECYTCREACFQRYSMADIFRTAKHLAVEQGTTPAGSAEGMAAFRRSARLVEGSASQRKRLGLPEAPASGSQELSTLFQWRPEPRRRGDTR
jgi:CoB--CoM heterodisulfide reductase subunit B